MLKTNYSIILLPIFIFVYHLNAQQYADSSSLNELVVSANKLKEPLKDIPRQILLITNKQIQQLNQPTTAELLQQTGEVYIQKSQLGGGSPIIRGMEANRILIVIDGVRLNNAIFRSGHLQNVLRISQQSLQNVEVLFGSGSIMYGSDAMGGVIHFTTQTPVLNSKSGQLYYRFGSAATEQTFHVNIMQGFKKWAFLFNYTNSHFGDLVQGKNRNNAIGNIGLRPFYQGNRDSMDRVVINSNPHKQVASAYNQADAILKILFEPNPKINHVLNLQFSTTGNVPRYDRLSEFKGDTPVFAEWYYGPELRTFFSYQLNNLNKHLLFDACKTTIAHQYVEESRNTRSFNNPSLNIRKEFVHAGSVNIDFFKQLKNHEIRYGTEFVLNAVNSFAYARNLNSLQLKPISTRYPDGINNYIMAAFYISNSLEYNNKIIFTYGLRLNYTYLKSTFENKFFYSFLPDMILQTNTSVVGSIGLVYKYNKNIRLYANTANAFRAPNVDDAGKIFDSRPGRILIMPNNSLKPEQSINSEIGSNIYLNKFTINFSAYYTYLYNAIQISRDSNSDSALYDGNKTPVFYQTNVKSAYIFGYGCNVKYSFLKNFYAMVNYNFTYGNIIQPASEPLDHIPPAYGKVLLNYYNNYFNFSFYSLYAVAKNVNRYSINGEDNLQYATANGLPAWYTLNTSAMLYNKNKSFTLQAAVENLLDINYRLFASGISAPGRNFIIAASYKF